MKGKGATVGILLGEDPDSEEGPMSETEEEYSPEGEERAAFNDMFEAMRKGDQEAAWSAHEMMMETIYSRWMSEMQGAEGETHEMPDGSMMPGKSMR